MFNGCAGRGGKWYPEDEDVDFESSDTSRPMLQWNTRTTSKIHMALGNPMISHDVLCELPEVPYCGS